VQYFVDVIREQRLVEWGEEESNGGPFDEGELLGRGGIPGRGEVVWV
jgi:hypothetical protein